MSEEKKQQVIALGRLGWPLRQIERQTGVRRETVGDYLGAAGVPLRPPGGWGRRPPAKPANEVTPDPDASREVARSTGIFVGLWAPTFGVIGIRDLLRHSG